MRDFKVPMILFITTLYILLYARVVTKTHRVHIYIYLCLSNFVKIKFCDSSEVIKRKFCFLLKIYVLQDWLINSFKWNEICRSIMLFQFYFLLLWIFIFILLFWMIFIFIFILTNIFTFTDVYSYFHFHFEWVLFSFLH